MLTAADLHDAFAELGALVRAEGKVIDLTVYGGSALMLVSNFRIGSDDVDAVAVADQPFIDRAAAAIAARRGWPGDWLNDGVRTYLSPLVEPPEAHALFAAYPSEAEPGLRVFVPTAEYMLAMKLMALRIDPGEEKDLGDILHLLRVVGLREKGDILDFAAEFYPEARISGKLHLAIDDIWRLHQAADGRTDEPPRYLGRSGPAPEG